MSKKKKGQVYRVNDKELQADEIIIYGSTNGWLRTVGQGGVAHLLIPDGHKPEDEPATWYVIGKYREEMEKPDEEDQQ